MKLVKGKKGENEINKPKMIYLRETEWFWKGKLRDSEKLFIRIMKAVRFLKIDDRQGMLSLAACRKSSHLVNSV